MIDTLRDSLTTQGQIADSLQSGLSAQADTLRDALTSLYTLEVLLCLVVALLIIILVAQCRTVSALRYVLRRMCKFNDDWQSSRAVPIAPLYSSTRVWKPRKRRKRKKHRNAK